MGSTTQTVLGLAATTALIVLDQLLPPGNVTLLIVVAVLAVTSAIGGRRLPLFVRVVATGAIFYLAHAAPA